MISQRVIVALTLRHKEEQEVDLWQALAKVVETLETYTQDSPHTRASKALSELERALKDCGV